MNQVNNRAHKREKGRYFDAMAVLSSCKSSGCLKAELEQIWRSLVVRLLITILELIRKGRFLRLKIRDQLSGAGTSPAYALLTYNAENGISE